MKNNRDALSRRSVLELLCGTAMAGFPEIAFAEARDEVLVIGVDISDAVTYDPATEATYMGPMVLKATYDSLVTMAPGHYIDIQPSLATAWQRTPNGSGWRFTLRQGAKFNSGNPVTTDDVKWSFDRVINMRAQPAQYIENVADVVVVDTNQVDFLLKDPDRPVLDILCSPAFSIYDSKTVQQHGGDASKDAASTDKATAWLNQHSCGSGPYTLLSWQRNSSVRLERNPHSWRGQAPFKQIVILSLSDPAGQLLALQRGTTDVALNLIPEQLSTLKGSKTIRLEPLESLDAVYIALTSNAEFNKALAVREIRQAIGYAIDYDGITKSLLGGSAVRPASLLCIGLLGSTKEVTKEIGFHEDLAKAKALLREGGYPDGFEFKMTYGTSLVAGVSYAVIAQKIQSDLARVGIKVILAPLDYTSMRTEFFTGRSTGTLIVWNSPAVDNWQTASATVQRIAKRVHWDAPAEMTKLVDRAADEPDREKQAALWVEYQKRMVEQANLIVLFQPIYQIAVANRITDLPLTAAGGQVDLATVKT